MDHDVVIVGGGPSGLSTALSLVQQRPSLAARLVVLEKAHYPREKICGGAVAGRADRALAELGLHVDVPEVKFTRMSVRYISGSVVTAPAAAGRVIRRVEFDARLAQLAKDRGIRIVEGTRVLGLERVHGGLVVRTSCGDLRSRVVVGADGVGSVVRKLVCGRVPMWRAQVLEVDTEPAAKDLARDTVHFDLSDPSLAGYAWDFPTLVAGRPAMCRGVYHLLSPGQPADERDLQSRLRARLAALGLDLGTCVQKRYAERGFVPRTVLSCPHVLLVGEAAGIDPLTGEGIAQAILYGRTVAPYLVRRLESQTLHFRDWKRVLSFSRVGLDLRIRHGICRLTFGPARRFYDRWITENPQVLDLGARYFGGRPLSRLALAGICARAVHHVMVYGAQAGAFRGMPLPR